MYECSIIELHCKDDGNGEFHAVWFHQPQREEEEIEFCVQNFIVLNIHRWPMTGFGPM